MIEVRLTQEQHELLCDLTRDKIDDLAFQAFHPDNRQIVKIIEAASALYKELLETLSNAKV